VACVAWQNPLYHAGTEGHAKVQKQNWRPSFPPFQPANVSVSVSSTIMPPQLDAATHVLIESLLDKEFENKLIASGASCSVRTAQRERRKRQQLEMLPPRTNRVGRYSCITSSMQAALLNMLIKQPYLYRYEMADFFYRRFRKRVSERSIGRTLRSKGWTRKTIHRIAQQRNADLREYYLHRISKYKSYQLLFVDESGCNGKGGQRRWGWSPKGSSPVEVTKFSRGKRWHILPAYAQDGILLRRVYQGSTDSDLFEDFIAQLLHHCGRYPEPKSVIVMDNASWHKSKKIRQMCQDAGVILEFLSPYSPDFNPIEEHFGVLKRFIKKKWYENEDFIAREFKMFLEWCVDVVGADAHIAENHFRHAGISITQPPK
jgi:transposase